jgi:hypothetical protein
MSLESMQSLLWRGVIDREFLTNVLDSPQTALLEYDLTPAEYAALSGTRSRSIVDIAHTVEALRRGEPLTAPEGVLALTG